MTFDFSAAGEPRVLELVNKTNQFNLNGKRYAQADWHKLVSDESAVLVGSAVTKTSLGRWAQSRQSQDNSMAQRHWRSRRG